MRGGRGLGPGHYFIAFETNVKERGFVGDRVRREGVVFFGFYFEDDPPADDVGDAGEAEFGVQRDLVLVILGVVTEHLQEGVGVKDDHSFGHGYAFGIAKII